MSDSGEIVAPPGEQPVAETRPEMETEGKEKEVKEEKELEKEKDKDKPVKEKKKSKVEKPRVAKAAASHPPYFQMIKEAITSLNEKSGSSPHAIAKFIEEKHKSVLPANFRKMLSLQLKNSVVRGKLVKVRASYKLSQSAKKEKTATKKSSAATTKAARANAAKPEETAKVTTGKRSKRARSKSVNQIDSKIASGAVRKSRKLAPGTKARQPKSIKKGKK